MNVLAERLQPRLASSYLSALPLRYSNYSCVPACQAEQKNPCQSAPSLSQQKDTTFQSLSGQKQLKCVSFSHGAFWFWRERGRALEREASTIRGEAGQDLRTGQGSRHSCLQENLHCQTPRLTSIRWASVTEKEKAPVARELGNIYILTFSTFPHSPLAAHIKNI